MSQLIWTAGKWRHALGSLTWRKREKKGQKENRNYETQIVVIRNLTLCKWKNSRERRCPWLFCVSTVSRTASGVPGIRSIAESMVTKRREGYFKMSAYFTIQLKKQTDSWLKCPEAGCFRGRRLLIVFFQRNALRAITDVDVNIDETAWNCHWSWHRIREASELHERAPSKKR